jgi:hypothetical protein
VAIRKGQWKLIPAAAGAGRAGGGAGRTGAPARAAAATGPASRPAGGGYGSGPGPIPQLYNLAEDIGETKNVAAAHPEIVKELTELLAKARTDDHTRP